MSTTISLAKPEFVADGPMCPIPVVLERTSRNASRFLDAFAASSAAHPKAYGYKHAFGKSQRNELRKAFFDLGQRTVACLDAHGRILWRS